MSALLLIQRLDDIDGTARCGQTLNGRLASGIDSQHYSKRDVDVNGASVIDTPMEHMSSGHGLRP